MEKGALQNAHTIRRDTDGCILQRPFAVSARPLYRRKGGGMRFFRENALTRKTNVYVRQKNTFLKKCPRYTEKVVEKWRIIYYYNGSCLA